MSRQEPVRNTCPDIDGVLVIIQSIEDLSKTDSENIDDLQDVLSQIKNLVWGIDGTLEQLRTANSLLREWGNEMKNEAIEFENKFDESEQKLAEAEEIIQGLKNELKEAQITIDNY